MDWKEKIIRFCLESKSFSAKDLDWLIAEQKELEAQGIQKNLMEILMERYHLTSEEAQTVYDVCQQTSVVEVSQDALVAPDAVSDGEEIVAEVVEEAPPVVSESPIVWEDRDKKSVKKPEKLYQDDQPLKSVAGSGYQRSPQDPYYQQKMWKSSNLPSSGVMADQLAQAFSQPPHAGTGEENDLYQGFLSKSSGLVSPGAMADQFAQALSKPPSQKAGEGLYQGMMSKPSNLISPEAMADQLAQAFVPPSPGEPVPGARSYLSKEPEFLTPGASPTAAPDYRTPKKVPVVPSDRAYGQKIEKKMGEVEPEVEAKPSPEKKSLGKTLLKIAAIFLILAGAGFAGWMYREEILNYLGKKPSSKISQRFTFIASRTYTCGGITHTVQEYQHNQSGLYFVLIPGGKFIMGSNLENEAPPHEVTIAPFFMSKYEVSQSVWQKIMGRNDSFHKGDDTRPVENVSFQECEEFCKKTGLKLPSEAQWEYACRAGSSTRYYWGNEMRGEYAWYKNNANEQTQPVGMKYPNAFGLHDMVGNVWEWCSDDWHSSYENAPKDGSPRQTLRKKIVRRGGSALTPDEFCRSTFRSWLFNETKHKDLGFRVCADIE